VPTYQKRHRERHGISRNVDGHRRDRETYDDNWYEKQYDEYHDTYDSYSGGSSNPKYEHAHHKYHNKLSKKYAYNPDNNGDYSTFNAADERSDRDQRYSQQRHYNSADPNQFQTRNRERYYNRGRRTRGTDDINVVHNTYENGMANRGRQRKRGNYNYTQHKNLGY